LGAKKKGGQQREQIRKLTLLGNHKEGMDYQHGMQQIGQAGRLDGRESRQAMDLMQLLLFPKRGSGLVMAVAFSLFLKYMDDDLPGWSYVVAPFSLHFCVS
jgi:hypothetical protein